MSIELHSGDRGGLTRNGAAAVEPRSFDETWRLAVILAKTRMFGLLTPDDAFVVLATGMELGVPAMTAPRAIYVFDGKPGLYAQFMVALVRVSGRMETWKILERTTTRCVIETKRAGANELPMTFTWTIERAAKIMIDKERKTPLTSKPTWQNDPEGMLYNRCASEASRVLYSDVTLGLYTPDELETRVFESAGEIVEPKPVRVAVTVADAQPPAARPAPISTPSDDVEVWRARFAAAQTLAELAEVRGACPKALQSALKADYAAAKSRLDPKPPTGGAPKPEAQKADTDEAITGKESDYLADTASSAAILAQWREHLATHTTPQHVINSLAAHIGEFAESMRPAIIEAAAARCRAFKWAETADVDGEIKAALARRVIA